MLDFLIARYLYRMSDLTRVLNGENYSSRAFFKAALTIDGYGKNTFDAYKKRELTKLPSIGNKIKNYIIEILETGTLSALNNLQGELPDSIYEILDLPQLNHKIIKKLIDNGIHDINTLKILIDKGNLQDKDFKASEINKISLSINKYDEDYGKFQFGHALCIANEIIRWLMAQNNVIMAEAGGEVRLKNDLITKLHILMSVTDQKEIETFLIKCPFLFSIRPLMSGELNAVTYLNLPVSILLVEENDFYYELLKSTGPSQFVNKLLNMTDNYRSITTSSKSEEEVFKKLNVPFIIPEIRYSPDKPIKSNNILNLSDYLGDLHVHTNWSDGIDSLENMVLKAREMGFKYLAVCDHSQSLKIANGLSVEAMLKQAEIIRDINNKFDDFKIIAGAEVDIKQDGSLDYPDFILEQLDFVVAAIHNGLQQPRHKMTERLKKGLSNKYVNVFAHPTGRLLGKPGKIFESRPEINISFYELLDICKENDVALEINSFPERLDLNRDKAAEALLKGIKLSIGTDAHAAFHLNLYKYGINIARAAGADKQFVLNTFSYEQLIKMFKQKRGKKDLNSEILLYNANKNFNFYFSNNKSIINGEKTVVGIDLTASTNKATGWAFLKSHHAITKLLITDDEIVEETVKHTPDIISIDSPLSIPAGRCCTNDNCSCRKKGIMRYCELTLMRMDIGVFPCLLPSMAGLTERGIRLANIFRDKGFKVIESYPGVAQDILKISRKQKGIENLIRGLKTFGITGDLKKQSIVHDELDAITSALVGYFYINDQYIPLGNEEEDYLIIPRVQTDTLHRRLIIGITGETASGKTTLAEYLRFKYGFKYKRYSQIISEMLNGNISKLELQKKGLEISRSKNGQKQLNERLIADIKDGTSYVIDGLRQVEDFEFLKNYYQEEFVLLFIDTSLNNRFKRYKKNVDNEISMESFKELVNHEVEQKIPILAFNATYRIENNRGFVDMFTQTDALLNDFLSRGASE